MVHVHGRQKANMNLGNKCMELLGKILARAAVAAAINIVYLWVDAVTTEDGPIGEK